MLGKKEGLSFSQQKERKQKKRKQRRRELPSCLFVSHLSRILCIVKDDTATQLQELRFASMSLSRLFKGIYEGGKTVDPRDRRKNDADAVVRNRGDAHSDQDDEDDDDEDESSIERGLILAVDENAKGARKRRRSSESFKQLLGADSKSPSSGATMIASSTDCDEGERPDGKTGAGTSASEDVALREEPKHLWQQSAKQKPVAVQSPLANGAAAAGFAKSKADASREILRAPPSSSSSAWTCHLPSFRSSKHTHPVVVHQKGADATELCAHLSTWHESLWNAICERIRERKSYGDLVEMENEKAKQRDLSFFSRSARTLSGGNLRKQLSLTLWACSLGISFSSLSSPSFARFLHECGQCSISEYEFNRCIDLAHFAVMELVRKQCSTWTFCALSGDCWTNICLEKFITVSAYHVTEKFETVETTLCCAPLGVSETASNLRAFVDILVQDILPPRCLQFSFTSDGGSAISAMALDLAGEIGHQWCLAHCIQRVVEPAIASTEGVMSAINLCRKWANDVRSRSNHESKLRLLQSKFAVVYMPIVAVDTRWGSTLMMLDRMQVLLRRGVVKQVIESEHFLDRPEQFSEVLQPHFLADLTAIVQLLLEFHRVTVEASESGMTQVPVCRQVRRLFACVQEQRGCGSPLAERLKFNLRHFLELKLGKVCGTINMATIALILDPQQIPGELLTVIPDETITDGSTLIERIWRRIILEELEIDGLQVEVDNNGAVKLGGQEEEESGSMESEAEKERLSIALSHAACQTAVMSLKSLLATERKKLQHERQSFAQFYSDIAKEKDNICRHVRALLPVVRAIASVPASSVRDERTFKISSRNSTKLRANMAPTKLAKVAMLASHCDGTDATFERVLAHVTERLSQPSSVETNPAQRVVDHEELVTSWEDQEILAVIEP